MSGTPQDPAGGAAIARLVTPPTLLSAGFVVDVAILSREPGSDLLEPLIFAAIVQANRGALQSDAKAREAYGATDAVLPDELRRPISINAVAHSLRLPFETVRRKVARLAEDGRCVVTPAGAYIPAAAASSEPLVAINSARMSRLERFHEDLLRAGFLSKSEALPGRLPENFVRPVNRIVAEYMLRSCERMIELVRGVLDGFMLLGLCAANAEHLAFADGEPLPCSARSLGERLELPAETVRRRLGMLQAAEFARQTPAGWLVAAPERDRERIERLVAENERDVRRLFGSLRELVAAV